MAKQLPKRVKYWLLEAKHDCFFLVGTEQGPRERIGALKHLLMAESEPMRAMLQDSEIAEQGDIKLIDVEPETFKNFLICVYGGVLLVRNLAIGELAKLLYLADKYIMEDMKNEISSYMVSQYSHNKLFKVLSHQVCLNDERLSQLMLRTLQSDFRGVLTNKAFLNLHDFSMAWILQQTNLNVMEIEIWEALLKWAEKKTNFDDKKVLRSFLYPFLRHIRFLTMDYKDFWTTVVPSGILLQGEIIEICQAYNSGNIQFSSFQHLCNNREHRCNQSQTPGIVLTNFWKTTNIAFMSYSVININDLTTDFAYSEIVNWAGHFWQVMVKKTAPIGSQDKSFLSIFIKCSNQADNWSCDAIVYLTLVNQIGRGDVLRSAPHRFYHKEDDWGWSGFYDWDKMIDTDQGFNKANEILVLARLQLN